MEEKIWYNPQFDPHPPPLLSGPYFLGEIVSIIGIASIAGILNTSESEIEKNYYVFHIIALVAAISLAFIVLVMYPAFERYYNPVFYLRDEQGESSKPQTKEERVKETIRKLFEGL